MIDSKDLSNPETHDADLRRIAQEVVVSHEEFDSPCSLRELVFRITNPSRLRMASHSRP